LLNGRTKLHTEIALYFSKYHKILLIFKTSF